MKPKYAGDQEKRREAVLEDGTNMNELSFDWINPLITIIGIAIAYKIGKSQSINQARFKSYSDFMIVLGEGKDQFPKYTPKDRTNEEIEKLQNWLHSFYTTRATVKIFGSKTINQQIDQLLDEEDNLDTNLLYQLNFLKIKLSQDHAKLAKQLNSKDKYDKFSEEISSEMKREISKPSWQFWK